MKKALLSLSILVLLFGLAACGSDPEPDTTAPVLTGVEDITILKDVAFDPLDGVTATDDVDGDVSEDITVTGTVDITTTGTYFLRYTAVDAAGNSREETRYVTVEVDTSSLGDEMVPNGDFELGFEIWSTTTGNEGGTANYSVSDGVLAVEVLSASGSSNPFEPRLENIGIEFEQGKTYEVSFEAWALAPRSIKVQVGELLSGAPWFNDFKTGLTTIFDLTTEKETYTFKFNMNEDTNENGALIFEMGTVIGNVGTDNVLTTVYYDNVVIVEAEPDEDTEGPVFTGIANKTIQIGTTFDPMAGVSASDVAEGAVAAEDIEVVITDSSDAVVATLDTSVAGTYTVTYTAEDSSGNETVESMTLTIQAFTFTETDLIVNGDLSGDDLTPWTNFVGGGATATFELVDGAVEVDVTNGGEAFWAIQLIQAGVTLEQGVTYQLSFDAKAEAARDISAVFYNADTGINYLQSGPIALTTEMETYEFIFTMDAATIETQLQVLLGTVDNFAAGTVTFDNFVLSTMDAEPIVENSDFEDIGWTGFVNDWEGSVATLDMIDGELVYELTEFNNTNQVWLLQLIHNEKLTLTPETTYVFSMDARASEALTLNPFFTQNDAGGFNNFADGNPLALTTTSQNFTFEFTTSADLISEPVEFKFEFGDQFDSFEAGVADAVAKMLYFDNLSLKVKDTTTELFTNSTADQALGYETFSEGAGQVTASVEEGLLTLDVTGLGEQAYQPHFFQMIGDLGAGNYVLVVRLESDVDRDVRINVLLPDADYASLLEDNFVDVNLTADDPEEVIIRFTVANAVTNVKLELSLGTLGGDLVSAIGTLEIDEILMYQNYNTQD